MLRALLCLVAAWVALADEPANITESLRVTLDHGRSLLREGDREAALGHFEGALLDKPCLVWLDLSGAPADRATELRLASLQAFGLWNEAFPEDLAFHETGDEARAQIKLRFVQEVRASAEKTVAGYIEARAPHVGKKVVQSFTASVAFLARDGVSPRPRASIVHVVAHELGHAVGVDDSPDRRNVMGPDAAQASVGLTDADRAAVRDLLGFLRRLIESAQGRPLSR